MGKHLLPTLFMTVGLSLSAATQTTCPSASPEQCIHSRVQIGANYTYAHITPSDHASFGGSLGGFQALYEFRTPDRIYGGVTFAFRDGNTEGSSGSRSLLEIDVAERIGYTFDELSDFQSFSLYTGFGYRHYGEKVTTAGSSITFDYNEFYVPVGFLYNYRINCTYAVGLNVQWMPQVYPTVAMDPLKGARWIITNELTNFRIEVPFTAVVCSEHNLSLVFQPFFEYWQDGHTTAATSTGLTLDIPGNTYLFAGADLNLRYSF